MILLRKILSDTKEEITEVKAVENIQAHHFSDYITGQKIELGDSQSVISTVYNLSISEVGRLSPKDYMKMFTSIQEIASKSNYFEDQSEKSIKLINTIGDKKELFIPVEPPVSLLFHVVIQEKIRLGDYRTVVSMLFGITKDQADEMHPSDFLACVLVISSFLA